MQNLIESLETYVSKMEQLLNTVNSIIVGELQQAADPILVQDESPAIVDTLERRVQESQVTPTSTDGRGKLAGRWRGLWA